MASEEREQTAGSTAPEEELVLSLLRARNRTAVPALAATAAATALLAECAALERQSEKEKQRADLIDKERHELVDDMELLRQNEANAGVSREHIEQLRDLLEKSKSEAAESAVEAATARASDSSASEAARLMGEKLGEAQAKAADLEHSLKLAAAREEALKAENARLIERLTLQLQAEAMAMDSEREKHEARKSGAALQPLWGLDAGSGTGGSSPRVLNSPSNPAADPLTQDPLPVPVD